MQGARPFDFIFIDGLHTAEAVAADLQLSAKHLTASGIMALHDCIGFWGANVRAGVLEFIRQNPSYRFMHPPYAELWRSVGIVAKAGSKAIDRASFATPTSDGERTSGLRETFGALLATTFGPRDVLEVSVGAPLLKAVAAPRRVVGVRVLGGKGSPNLNAELDRILTQFDKLDEPVLFSGDLLDFAPTELIQNLLAAVAHRKGQLLLGVTPPGEAKVAGPESRPAAWLVDLARGHRFAAYGPPLLDLEPARYSLLPEMRELGRNSQLASSVVLAARGGFVDAKRRKLVELTPALAAEREQAELQRVHLASGYRRFFNESHAKSEMLSEQSLQLHRQIHDAQEAAQREKRWREENSESLGAQVSRLTDEYAKATVRLEEMGAELAARDAVVSDLTNKLNETTHEGGTFRSMLEALAEESRSREAALTELSRQLATALEAGQREKAWREEATASFDAQIERQTQLADQARERAVLLEGELARVAEELEELKRLLEVVRREKDAQEEAAASFETQLARQTEVLREAQHTIGPLELELTQSRTEAAELRQQLHTALEAGQREQAWRQEAAVAHQVQIAELTEQYRGAMAREAALRAQNEASNELARLESELRDEKEAKLRTLVEELVDSDREREAVRVAAETQYQQRLLEAEALQQQTAEARSILEAELARLDADRRAALVREASLVNQLRANEELAKFELEARAEREQRLWKNLQEVTDAQRREVATRAALEVAHQERLQAIEGDLLRVAIERDALREELGGQIDELTAALAAEQQNTVQQEALIADLRNELSYERMLRADIEATAQEGGTRISELSAKLNAMIEAAQATDADSREALERLVVRLSEIRQVSDDYLVQLVDVYHAMDSFESLVDSGEATLTHFEHSVLGLERAETQSATSHPEFGDGADVASTSAEIARLKSRWQNLLTRFERSTAAAAEHVLHLQQQNVAASADFASKSGELEARLAAAEERFETELADARAGFQIQLAQERADAEKRLAEADAAAKQHLADIETDAALRLAEFDAAFRRQHAESMEAGARTQRHLVESQAFLEDQLAELKGALEARTSEGRDVSARLAALSAQNADFTQRLIDVYQALDEIDAAVAEQLRMCNETEEQLLGKAEPVEEVDEGGEPPDHLLVLRQRSRVLSRKIARLLAASQSRFRDAEESSRSLQSHAVALEAQITGIRRSTSWRVMAPVRAAGKPLRVLRRRVGARLRGQELLKVKAELDSRLQPLGLECPVFDAHRYAEVYGDVPANGALRHYLSFGENEGRQPLRTFDAGFYYNMYPDVQAEQASALLHFLKFGVHEGRSPCVALHPLGALAAEKGMSPLEFFARS
ncbi:MAG: class I SAM-dependent methyltransferase [Hyphomonadaceae bacterium]